MVGDKLYARGERHFLNYIARGAGGRWSELLGAERQLLHASRLSLSHPRSGATLTFEAPLPDDMSEFMARTRTQEDRDH